MHHYAKMKPSQGAKLLKNDDYNSEQVRYISKDTQSFQQLKWSPFLEPESRAEAKETRIHRRLLEECEKLSIPVAEILIYCSEGNNIPESLYLAKKFTEYFNVICASTVFPAQVEWKYPRGWEFLEFNPDIDMELIF